MEGGILDADVSAFDSAYANTDWFSLPHIDVARPATPPSSVTATASDGNGTWLDAANPNINVSWSGASAGTYTISRYSIDASKNSWSSSTNVDNVYTSSTSGSKNNVSLSSLGLSGGEKVKIRVGLMTSDNQWWGHGYWASEFKVYSRPTAPTTFNTPTSAEIDTSVTISWSGASAGSNGIAGYDLQVRGYNGSSWSSWYTVLSARNVTSYTVGTPKNLTINGVNYYSTYGERAKFQYRVRTSDGIISTSDWVTGNATSILINTPSVPRK